MSIDLIVKVCWCAFPGFCCQAADETHQHDRNDISLKCGFDRLPVALLVRLKSLAIIKTEARLRSRGPLQRSNEARFFGQRDPIDIAQGAANTIEKPAKNARARFTPLR